MKDNNALSRRSNLKSMGVLGAAAILGTQTASGSPGSGPAFEPLMRGNARQLFNLQEKERVLQRALWL